MSIGTSETSATKRRTPRWLWVVMVISLALNLLIIGAVAGAWVRHGKWAGPFGGWKGNYLMRGLPEDRREQVSAILGKHRRTLRPMRQEAHAAWLNVAGVLKEKNLDEQKLRNAIAQAQMAEAAARQRLVPMMLEVAQVLTLEERRKFVEHFQHRRSRHWHRRRDHDH